MPTPSAIRSASRQKVEKGAEADVGADRTTVSLGYDDQFCKRTDLYAVCMCDRQSG